MVGFVRWCSLATALATSERRYATLHVVSVECPLIIADSANLSPKYLFIQEENFSNIIIISYNKC